MTRLVTTPRLFAALAVALLLASLGLEHALRVDRHGAVKRTIVSAWQGGKRRARTVVPESGADHALLDEARSRRAVRVAEDVLDEGPVLSTQSIIFGASFVPGRDGVEARYGDRVAYATVDDLLALKAYDHTLELGPLRLQLGVDADVVFDALARELRVSRAALLNAGKFRRLALRHRVPPEPSPVVDEASLRTAAVSAGRYLARAVRSDGLYRYEVSGIDDQDSDDYNWPRHAGATWFLAETANYTREPALLDAVARAARKLTEGTLVDCGEHRCIAAGDRADLGSSALGLLALVEVVEGGACPS